MKNSKFEIRNSKFWFILLLIFVFPNLVFASRIVSFRQAPRITWDISTQYDDNIFLYSQEYLYDFKHQIRPHRFPFRTYDDLVTRLNLGLYVPLRAGNQRTNINMFYRQYLYAVNTQKSYQIISASINQQIANRFNIELGYLLMPSYLIRYYRNPLGPATDYTGCIFTEHLMTARLQSRFTNLTLTPFFQYEIDDYIKNFDHYDGYALRYGLNAFIRQLSFVNISAGFMRKQYYAQGSVPDISYHENRFSLRLTPSLGMTKFNLSTQIQYARRVFTTDNPFQIDPYHRDRIDSKYTANIELSYEVSRNFEIYTGYEFEQRRVTTPFQIDIEEIKDYNNNIYRLGVKFNPGTIFNAARTSNIEHDQE
ncbi:MAG: hypothetical protein KGZ86_03515 [Candidatus Latescibacteria bacterium]|nr:hypothetical protein [Candidatus Latescibacterota bacterium]